MIHETTQYKFSHTIVLEEFPLFLPESIVTVPCIMEVWLAFHDIATVQNM